MEVCGQWWMGVWMKVVQKVGEKREIVEIGIHFVKKQGIMNCVENQSRKKRKKGR